MCLQVFPNGYGVGYGTHVAVFTCIMRGAHDRGLRWPFRGDITIQIVNQAGENHLEKINHYTDQTPDSGAGRRTYGSDTAMAWGFPKFLPHTSLGYSAARNTQYLLEDCLRIQITRVRVK